MPPRVFTIGGQSEQFLDNITYHVCVCSAPSWPHARPIPNMGYMAKPLDWALRGKKAFLHSPTSAFKNDLFFLPESFRVGHTWASNRADHHGPLGAGGSAQKGEQSQELQSPRSGEHIITSQLHCWTLPSSRLPSPTGAPSRVSHKGIWKYWSPKKELKVLDQSQGGKNLQPTWAQVKCVYF